MINTEKMGKSYLQFNMFCCAVLLAGAQQRLQAASKSAHSEEEPWAKEPLLPKHITPEHYDLSLYPDLAQGIFTGELTVRVDVTKPTKYLLLHSHDLEVTNTLVSLAGTTDCFIPIEKSFAYKPNQFWVIKLEDELSPGKYNIAVAFSGSLTGNIIGLYRSSYRDNDGNTRYLATTKFEPTHARHAFPCFDEPSFKATFSISLVRPTEDYIALSNMAQVEEKESVPKVGLTTAVFQTTPPMSTYLAIFVVCDFESLPPVKSKSGVPITAYARQGQAKNMAFSKDVAVKATDFYTEYFGIDYALPKIDLLPVPDFVSGAMENWGLITFRESAVLIAKGVSTSLNEDQVSNTVSHEIAHMWFGNLVTMAWWDDLWLNEGFAAFLQVKCVQHIFPEWDMEGISVVRSQHFVLSKDATLSSHPIIQTVSHPDQITEMFDSISYNKGAAILRMLESLSPEKFQQAVSKYLKKFEYRNAKTDDLWSAMGEEMSDVNITRLMGTWTMQMGYPIVSVTREGDKVVFTQQRFLADSESTFSPDTSPFKYKWDIPITYITSSDTKKVEMILFNLDCESVTVTLPPDVEWIKINVKQVGFYRVNYTDEDWNNFINILKKDCNVMTPIDRANLIDDAFSLAEGGYLDYKIPFNLIGYFQKGQEKSLPPWSVLLRHFNKLKNKLRGTPSEYKFMNYMRNLVGYIPSYNIWQINPEDTFMEKRVKRVLLSFACELEIPEVKSKMQELFNDWIEGRTDKPNAEIRSLVYRHGISGEGDTKKWEKLWELYLVESDPHEKSNFMKTLASVNNTELLARLLELMKKEEFVRSQDYFSFMMTMSETPIGNDLVWEFLRSNWQYLIDRFTLNHRIFGRILPYVTQDFSTPELLEEVNDLIAKYPEAGAGSAGRKNALEEITNNIKWTQKYLHVIEALLQ